MPKRGSNDVVNNAKTRQILLVFSNPKTPRQAEKELCITKIKLRPFLEQHMLRCLNPDAVKGRFYVISDRARKCFHITRSLNELDKDWELIGWIVSSPRQRLAVIRVIDERKRASEEIRARATQFNSHLSRPSTKNILKELMQKRLVDSSLFDKMRLYWANEYGTKIKNELAVIAPLSPSLFGV